MNTILVALDSSPRAPHVLSTAVELARRTGAKVTLFRSVGVPPEINQEEVIGLSPGALSEKLVEAAKEGLLTFRDEVPLGILESIEVRLGTPWSAICEEAKAIKADLIVIGSHGYGALDRILGTTAAKVVNHAECSVLVVR